MELFSWIYKNHQRVYGRDEEKKTIRLSTIDDKDINIITGKLIIS